MLNEGKRVELLYFLREIVLESGVSDKLAEPFMASLVAKGARDSVETAMEFLDSKIEIFQCLGSKLTVFRPKMTKNR